MPEALLDVRHEAGYLEIIYSKFSEVRECRKVPEGVLVKPFGGELGIMIKGVQADPEQFDERKQTELVRSLERPGPQMRLVPLVPEVAVLCREGVMKMGDGDDVPRVACHGTCEEGGGVVNEVGHDHFYEVLWELGDWGRTFRRFL